MWLHWALEGEVVAVGVGDGEAAHVVARNKGLFQNIDAEGKKKSVGGVHVGAAEIERSIAVRGEAGGIGRRVSPDAASRALRYTWAPIAMPSISKPFHAITTTKRRLGCSDSPR